MSTRHMQRAGLALALTTFATSAMAQAPCTPYDTAGCPPGAILVLPADCSPYDLRGCPGAAPTPPSNPTTDPAAFDGPMVPHTFGNVFVNQPGSENVFVSIINDVPDVNVAVIHVQIPTPAGAEPRIYRETLVLGPSEMVEPLRINGLPLLEGYAGGVFIRVSTHKAATVTVAEHGQVGAPDYWKGAKRLEGQVGDGRE